MRQEEAAVEREDCNDNPQYGCNVIYRTAKLTNVCIHRHMYIAAKFGEISWGLYCRRGGVAADFGGAASKSTWQFCYLQTSIEVHNKHTAMQVYYKKRYIAFTRFSDKALQTLGRDPRTQAHGPALDLISAMTIHFGGYWNGTRFASLEYERDTGDIYARSSDRILSSCPMFFKMNIAHLQPIAASLQGREPHRRTLRNGVEFATPGSLESPTTNNHRCISS
jgi:hypothetical protein